MQIEPSDQDKIDVLQFMLLHGRLPADLAAHVHHLDPGDPVELSAAVCLIFAGMGLHWPIPCLARRANGDWFDVDGAGPGDGTEWSQ